MAIILDMDGTILNAAPSILRCLNQAFEEMGHDTLSMSEAIGLSGVPLDGILRSRLTEEELPEGRERYRKIHYTTFKEDTHVFPGAREALEKWRDNGEKMAVFTLRRGDNARQVLSAFDLLDLFEGVVGHNEAPEPKPSPAHTETAAELLGVDVEDTLVIGDNKVDIISGSKAGAKTIGVLWGLGSKQELIEAGAWKTAEDWHELTRIVMEWIS